MMAPARAISPRSFLGPWLCLFFPRLLFLIASAIASDASSFHSSGRPVLCWVRRPPGLLALALHCQSRLGWMQNSAAMSSADSWCSTPCSFACCQSLKRISACQRSGVATCPPGARARRAMPGLSGLDGELMMDVLLREDRLLPPRAPADRLRRAAPAPHHHREPPHPGGELDPFHRLSPPAAAHYYPHTARRPCAFCWKPWVGPYARASRAYGPTLCRVGRGLRRPACAKEFIDRLLQSMNRS